MTLLSVVKDVCAVVGVTVPTSVTTNIAANRTMQEMLALANEMAQRISYDTRDWTLFKKTQVFSGDGVKTAFDLPDNYKRMLLTANVWRSTSALQPMMFVPDFDRWMQRRALNWYSPWGEWTLAGGQMLIQPVMGENTLPLWLTTHAYNIIGEAAYDNVTKTSWKVAVAHVSGSGTFAADRTANPTYWTSTPNVPVTATFAYIDKNCVKLASGGVGDSFLADTDSFRLDERLLKLGMVWQWKANKGTSYAEDMGTYADALSIAMGHDSPAPIIIGRRPMSQGRTAYPFPVPTP
jgi:hypothetical protein